MTGECRRVARLSETTAITAHEPNHVSVTGAKSNNGFVFFFLFFSRRHRARRRPEGKKNGKREPSRPRLPYVTGHLCFDPITRSRGPNRAAADCRRVADRFFSSPVAAAKHTTLRPHSEMDAWGDSPHQRNRRVGENRYRREKPTIKRINHQTLDDRRCRESKHPSAQWMIERIVSVVSNPIRTIRNDRNTFAIPLVVIVID